MPQVTLGPKTEPAIELTASTDLIAVRTRSRRSLRSGPVLAAGAKEVADGNLILAFPDAGVEVYRVSPERRSLDARKQGLRADPEVRFAGGVLVDRAGQPVVYTENLVVKFVDTVDPDACKQVLARAGLVVRRQLDYATNAFFAAAPEGTGQRVFDIAAKLLAREDVEYCHPELVRKRRSRALFSAQWHLARTTLHGQVIDAHANVELAHAITRGEGTTIAIIDDGVDIDHPEFSTPGKVVAARDVTFPAADPRGRDPRPKDTFAADDHGTACAGVACASGVGSASGVAPEAKLLPIRNVSGLGSVLEADAFKWAADQGADVISCSWGPADGYWADPDDPVHRERVPLPASTRLALEYAIRQGRGGKGCVILFAAGNGNESVDNDGYASFQDVIAVAACNDRSRRSAYSDFGKAVFCSFPSSDFAFAPEGRPAPLTPGIWTTDRSRRLGYNPGRQTDGDLLGDYTNSFGGTSSACPGAAGIAALILSVNPELRWHEVRDLMRLACDVVDPQNGQYVDGRSPFYGYGRLNAERAAQLAQPGARDRFSIQRTFHAPIVDLQTREFTLDVAEDGPITKFVVFVDLEHSYIGDLVITLVPPSGSDMQPAVLHDRKGGATANLKRAYDAAQVSALGSYEGSVGRGRWTLRIADTVAEDGGMLLEFGLSWTVGAASSPPRASGAQGAREGVLAMVDD